MQYSLTRSSLLLAILILAFVLRFWGIGQQDIFGDESAYAFRSIGYLDYLGTNFQTQPVDWYKDGDLPWWSKLSFHDHPPLVFLIQNLFFRIFGDSLLTARLPSIVLGTTSVYLFYRILRRFREETTAIFGALIFAISGAAVWISRSSLMEPILLFFILFSIYAFFDFLNNHSRWWVLGIALGLTMLTKYTGIFLVPVLFSFLLIREQKIFKEWRWYAAWGLAILIFTPVLLYNFYLYQERGHFDLQFSYLLGQKTPEWSGLVGKTQDLVSEIGSNLVEIFGYASLVTLLVAMLWYWDRLSSSGGLFFSFYFLWVNILFLGIGSAPRFLTLYIPFFSFWISLAWKDWLGFKKWRLSLIGAVIFLILELGFGWNKNWQSRPDYGVAKLDHFFEQEFVSTESGVIPESDNPHLNKIIHQFAEQKTKKPRRLYLIVYNDNIALPTLQWVFYRRFFYHSIPTLFVENFEKAIQIEGEKYFRPFDIYFVQSTKNTLLNPFKTEKEVGERFEKRLRDRGLEPIITIIGHRNLPMFRVYKFRFSG